MILSVEKIKLELQQIGSMRPGSLNKQFTVCGRPGCRCQDPDKPKRHGPYFQLSYVHHGKSTTQFIQKQLVPGVSRQLKNYKTFRALTAEWGRSRTGDCYGTTGGRSSRLEGSILLCVALALATTQKVGLVLWAQFARFSTA